VTMNVLDPNIDNVSRWLKKIAFFKTSTKLTENITDKMLHYLDQRTRKLVEAGMGEDSTDLEDTDRFRLHCKLITKSYKNIKRINSDNVGII
jgi:hypothetical protein